VSTSTDLITVQASSVTSFTGSLGINATIGSNASRAMQNFTADENALSYLGFKLVRSGVYTFNQPAYAQLNQDLGIKFDDIVSGVNTESFDNSLQVIEANPQLLAFVEGPNETDEPKQTAYYLKLSGLHATAAEMRALYSAVHSDPKLAGVGVIQASFGIPSSFAKYGNQSGSADYTNSHIYYNFYPFGVDPLKGNGYWMRTLLADAQSVTPGVPNIVTETGYITQPGSAFAVSDIDQAKYLLDDVFDLWNAGVADDFIFYLVDTGPNAGDTGNTSHYYGIFNADWTPKPAAIALHNLTTLLADTGTGGVAPGKLSYALSGEPSSVQTSLMEKSDGTFVLAIWNDVQLQNTSGVDVPVASVAVTLTLSKAYESINIYDPLTGTTVEESFANAQTVQIMVPDHPILIEISNTKPAATVAAANQPLINAPVTSLAAPDSISQVAGVSIGNDQLGNVTVRVTTSGGVISMRDHNNQALAGSGTDSILIAGSESLVNDELETLAYTAPVGFTGGSISLQVTGASGTVQTGFITVTAITRPAFTASIGPLLSAPANMSFSTDSVDAVSDVVLTDDYYAVNPGNLSLTVTTSFGELDMKSNGVELTPAQSLTVSGSYAQVAADLATLTYIAGGSLAQGSVSFSVTDAAGLKTTARIALNVHASLKIYLGAGPVTVVQGSTIAINAQIDDEADPGNAGHLTVTVKDKTGTLSMVDAYGYRAPGSGTSSITISGTSNQVNSELATLVLKATTSGISDSITFTVKDSEGTLAYITTAVTVLPLVKIDLPSTFAAKIGVISKVPGVSIVDSYAAANNLQVTAVVQDRDGKLSITNAAGDPVAGSGGHLITLVGSLAVVNAELATLLYTGPQSIINDNISVTASDTAGGSSSQAVAVPVSSAGTPAAYFWLVDTAGDPLNAQPFLNSGSMLLTTAATGMSGAVSEQTADGVVTLTDESWNTVYAVNLIDNSAGNSYVLNNFRSVTATLAAGPASGTSAQHLTVNDAQSGTITMGTGNQDVLINAGVGGATIGTSKSFFVIEGSGTDELTVNGYTGYLPTTDNTTITQALVTAGSGTDTMTFLNAYAGIDASSGAVIIHGSNYGTNFTAGTGTADIWGGGGANYFHYNPGDGLMTIEDFSTKNDTLLINSSMLAGMTETAVSGGVKLLFSSSPGSEILLKGVTTGLYAHISAI